MAAIYILLALLVVLEAAQQGIICWALREFVPESYNGVRLARYTSFALHTLAVVAYLLVAGLLAHQAGVLLNVAYWLNVVLLRVVLFDPTLNAAKSYMNRLFDRPAEPLFGVGTQSYTDLAVQALARRVKQNPSVVSAGLRVLAVALLVFLAI